MNTRDPDSAKQLLEAALANPFGNEEVREWLGYLAREFPLWSFQSWRYAELQSSDLPTNYPLQGMIESMCRDEGLEPGESILLERLDVFLDYLRYTLADYGREKRASTAPAIVRVATDWFLKDPTRQSLSRFNRIHALPEPWEYSDPKDPEASLYAAHYAAIGRRLVRLVEAREYTVPGTAERQKAEEEMQRFQGSLGVRLADKRPDTGPPKATLCQLVDQGTDLLAACWNALDTQAGALAKELLADAGATDPAKQLLWTRRLALPVLSLPEIRALGAEIERSRTWGIRPDRPTPQRMALWILEHRLGVYAETLARKAKGSNSARFFQGHRHENPIRKFLPD